MRFWIFSDLHLEMQKVRFPPVAPEGVDAILCAGDLCHSYQLRYWAKNIIDRYDVPMILVPGNHEFYDGKSYSNHSLSSKRKAMQKVAVESDHWKQKFVVLDDSAISLNGIHIIGGTLWTDFKLNTTSDSEVAWHMNDAIRMSPDFTNIYVGGGDMLTPSDTLKMHSHTKDFIKRELLQSSADKRVVITHHLPHPDCTPERYAGEFGNYMYASSHGAFCDVFDCSKAPDIWVCGHTHQAIDVDIGSTRVISNPMGFQVDIYEKQNGFRWDCVVDV